LFTLNLAAVIAGLGLFEMYISMWPPPEMIYKGSYKAGGYMIDGDPELGYIILPGKRIVTSVLKSPNKSVIYDVKYTINQYGLRQVSTPPNGRPSDESKPIFFFGDSFTFGEGVNDQDTLPQQFSVLSGLRAVNFGVHGYGPHQILRELETARPRIVEPRDPLAIVYTLPDPCTYIAQQGVHPGIPMGLITSLSMVCLNTSVHTQDLACLFGNDCCCVLISIASFWTTEYAKLIPITIEQDYWRLS
jgi:hypothetical protein